MRAKIFVVTAFFAAICSFGCMEEGVPKGVTVKGKIVKGGQVLKPTGAQAPGASKVEVMLFPAEPDGVVEQINLDEEGGFTLNGPGRGIKPGAYKVAVFVRNASWDSDELGGKFNKDNTPVSVTIPADKVGQVHDLGTIDLDNPPKG